MVGRWNKVAGLALAALSSRAGLALQSHGFISDRRPVLGLPALYSCREELFPGGDWTTTLGHLGLVAGAALERLYEEQEMHAERGRLQRQFLRVPLTGLPTRVALDRYVRVATSRVRRADSPLVVGFLELNDFK